MADELTLDVALAAERVGTSGATDLLAISFSATRGPCTCVMRARRSGAGA